jgi:hypothetical protein
MINSAGLREVARLCWECRTECQRALFNHCLIKGGRHAEAEHVKLMTDCIQICQITADFITRDSELYDEICAACAEVCFACAESCESLGDEDMDNCAEICRRCATACLDLANPTRRAA